MGDPAMGFEFSTLSTVAAMAAAFAAIVLFRLEAFSQSRSASPA